MNWLGKVFVVVILIMSLVFMGLSMAVYATHKNWKQVSEQLKTKVDQGKAENARLVAEHNKAVEQLDLEKKSAEQQVVKLEQERASLDKNNKLMQEELEGLKQNQQKGIAAVASTQALNQDLVANVTSLRGEIKTEQQKRDAAFKNALDATEELHQAHAEFQSARERRDQLMKQVDGMTKVMQSKGIDPATDPAGVVPTVEGVVNQIRRKDGTQLIEVSIGADDGLKTGNTLEVSRGSKYLGRLDIIETSPDKSVGRVDRNFLQGQIQEGDRVATRIKL